MISNDVHNSLSRFIFKFQKFFIRFVLSVIISLLVVNNLNSEQLNVIDQLDQMVLSISPDQVKGQPLQGPAQIILLDSTGSQLTTYDLSLNPITIQTDIGIFQPGSLTDNALFNNGIIDLTSAMTAYQGKSGVVRIQAVSDTIISNAVDVTFNGLDIISYSLEDGNPIQTVYSDLLTTVEAVVQNNGSLTPSVQPWVKSYFRSGGGSVKSFIQPLSNSDADTLLIDLPTDNIPAGSDTLVLLTQSTFNVNGTMVTTNDSVVIPVNVLFPSRLQFVDGSVMPDSVYATVPFDISFAVDASSFNGQIDSSSVTIRLYSDTNQAPLTTVYKDTPIPTSFVNDTIVYSGLEAIIDSAVSITPGTYFIRIDHSLVSQGIVFASSPRFPDSLTIVAPALLSYIDSTIQPMVISAETQSSFSFSMQLDDLLPLNVDSANSNFEITGNNFSTSGGLHVPNWQIIPGINTITVDSFFVPIDQIGEQLTITVNIVYNVQGASNSFKFTSNLANEYLHVSEKPRIRINRVFVISPNAPLVNHNQSFFISCIIENLSNVTVPAFDLKILSDGLSVYDTIMTIDSIAVADSVEVMFSVNAASQSNQSELFQVDVLSASIAVEPPLDNIASVTIQKPAELSIELSPVSDTVFIDLSSNFELNISITNSGESSILDGLYKITTNGVNLGIPDPFIDDVVLNTPIPIQFSSTITSQTIPVVVSFEELPIDINDSLPVSILSGHDTTFVVVTPLTGTLLYDAQISGSNYSLPGEKRELLKIQLTNTDLSPLSQLQIDSLTFHLNDRNGQPIEPSTRLEQSSVILKDENNQTLSVARFDPGYIVFILNNYTLGSEITKEATICGIISDDNSSPFTILLDSDDFFARFIAGPQTGQLAIPETPDGTGLIESEPFVIARGLSAQESFEIKNNPFNPNIEPAEFQFNLQSESAVNLRIFSLIGEEVLYRHYRKGDLLSQTKNIIEWDGKNNEGHTVLNGVYIVHLEVVSTGEEAKLKIAVLK